MRQHADSANIIAVIEPRSNTMRLGEHQDHLAEACQQADSVVWFKPESIDWDMSGLICSDSVAVESTIDAVINRVIKDVAPERANHIVIMSNGGFGGIHTKLLTVLEQKAFS